jgi:lipoate-protein ligase B
MVTAVQEEKQAAIVRSATSVSGENLRRQDGRLAVGGLVPFERAWAMQRELVKNRIAGRSPDTLVLLEHEPVFTIGRTGRQEHWGGDEVLSQRTGVPLYRIERGGSITYHGPGQVVGYPILMLRDHCAGPKTYMRRLEEVIIRTLAHWGIRGDRRERLTGVWVGDGEPEKVAAMGVRLVEGVTMHGFALNVDVDLGPFDHVTPCGIPGCRVTSMARLLGTPPPIRDVARRLSEDFGDVFHMTWTHEPIERLTSGV